MVVWKVRPGRMMKLGSLAVGLKEPSQDELEASDVLSRTSRTSLQTCDRDGSTSGLVCSQNYELS